MRITATMLVLMLLILRELIHVAKMNSNSSLKQWGAIALKACTLGIDASGVQASTKLKAI